MCSTDYESLWHHAWGDMQKYGPVHRHHRRIMERMLTKLKGRSIRSVADIGCGEGSNLLYLSGHFPGAGLFGFDISSAAIEQAKQKVDASFAILDVERETSSGQYDLVVCSDVLEHVANDVAALKNIFQLTGKYVIIASVQGRMRESEKKIGHVRSYAYGELRRKVELAGFTILKTVEWGFPLHSVYRDLVDFQPVTQASYGSYSPVKKFVCLALYALFMLNRSDKGDIIILLAGR
jgi:SAM-dependent methyltransferase